jgi:S-adenosylmethionine-dependent methyltransferase
VIPSIPRDRNFDELIDRFRARVYDTFKGEWRLKLLKQDLDQIVNKQTTLSVWDAGCGFAQISQWLAGLGHDVVLCDLSSKMLDEAKQNFLTKGLEAEFHHLGFQQFAKDSKQFDLILFHAVIEWLAEPIPGLNTVMEKTKSGGYLSLLFYNRNAMVYANVLKGSWRLKPILEDSYLGKGNKLTPPNPQYPHEMVEYLCGHGFDVRVHTGIRIFNDYMTDEVLKKTDLDELFALEERYCRVPAYRDMGRYIHILAQKNPA